MAADHKEHEENADWHADQELSLIGILGRNFPLLNNVGVDRHFMLEVDPLGGRFGLEAPDEPFVGDVVLLALPALMEQGDPDHNDYAVQDAERRGE